MTEHRDHLSDVIENAPEFDWLEQAHCGDLAPDQLSMFFVEAGKAISKEALDLCRQCCVRTECLTHAYQCEVGSGYFGGMSPNRRRTVPMEQALLDASGQFDR